MKKIIFMERCNKQALHFLFMFLLLAAISIPCAWAEMVTIITIADYLIFTRLVDDEMDDNDNNSIIGVANLLNTRLDIKSRGNKNVKAQFQLDSFLEERYIFLNVPRAYVKMRFPGFQATLGKTRVSWGEGFMFNAGDVIFGGMTLDVDISQSVLRDQTDILASVSIPLGSFSYIETVFFPFPTLVEVMPGTLAPFPRNIAETSAGGMITGEFFDITFEAGYFYRGMPQSHKPYIAVQGHLIADWYLAASCDIPHEDPDEDAFKENLAFSGGLFGIINLEGDANVSLRLETGIYPFGEWEEAETFAMDPYGIYFFPEIVFTPADNISYQLRSLISPVDGSGIVIAGMNWNMYQGFTLGFMATAMFGDEDDLFGWNRDSDLAFLLFMEYVFGE